VPEWSDFCFWIAGAEAIDLVEWTVVAAVVVEVDAVAAVVEIEKNYVQAKRMTGLQRSFAPAAVAAVSENVG